MSTDERLDLTVVGIGENGLASLSREALAAIRDADVVVGHRRHFELAGIEDKLMIPWRSPITTTLGEIERHTGRAIAVLASGDPLWFGVGNLLLRELKTARIRFIPTLSSIQFACAELHWPVETTQIVSVHGRPLETLAPHLWRKRRILVLTSPQNDAAAIGEWLERAGIRDLDAHILENLGGPGASIRHMDLRGLKNASPTSALAVVALDLKAGAFGGLAMGAGLHEQLFEHDGQITKAEIRAITLAALSPRPGQSLWDIGAGSGSISIEWLRAGEDMSAVAIERDGVRAARILRNAARFGVSGLDVVQLEAPACLADLNAPDAIFIGGGSSTTGMLETAHARLIDGGRLVANAVTVRGEHALLAFQDRFGGDLKRVAISRAEPVGSMLAWKPMAPVTQLVFQKR